MSTPSKYDLLIYLHFNEPLTSSSLEDILRRNIRFEDLNVRKLRKRMRELLDSDLVLKRFLSSTSTNEYSLNQDNNLLINHLSFLLWCRKEGIDYNAILDPKTEAIIFCILKHREISREKLVKESNISEKTLKKHTDILLKNKFIRVINQRPMVFEFLINDVTLWYLILKGLQIPDIANNFKNSIADIDAIKNIAKSKTVVDNLVKLHVYSSTVTEGNTASNEDVERVINDLPTDLTPKEIIEIKNTKDALDYVLEVYADTDVNIDLIKTTHQMLMRGLIKEVGIFYPSSTKRIIGSKFKLPSTTKEIEYLTQSLVNYCQLNKNNIHPMILGSIFHFLFVSIHPFKDGNGRVTRLIHSFILLKGGYPIFAFDPDRKYDYFNYLEKGREVDISDFIRFIVEEHKNVLLAQ